MSHPDPHGAPDHTPIQIGEVWENPMTGERAKIIELPYRNPEHRAVRLVFRRPRRRNHYRRGGRRSALQNGEERYGDGRDFEHPHGRRAWPIHSLAEERRGDGRDFEHPHGRKNTVKESNSTSAASTPPVAISAL